MAIEQHGGSRIAVRIIVEGTAEVAATAWAELRDRLFELGEIGPPTIRPYSKIPGSHEVASVLRPSAQDPRHAFDEVVQRLGTGWDDNGNEPFASWVVWNRGKGELVVPSALWAHVELIREL